MVFATWVCLFWEKRRSVLLPDFLLFEICRYCCHGQKLIQTRPPSWFVSCFCPFLPSIFFYIFPPQKGSMMALKNDLDVWSFSKIILIVLHSRMKNEFVMRFQIWSKVHTAWIEGFELNAWSQNKIGVLTEILRISHGISVGWGWGWYKVKWAKNNLPLVVSWYLPMKKYTSQLNLVL